MDPDVEDDDDWTKYADTGYESSYDPWADMVATEDVQDDEFEDEFVEKRTNRKQKLNLKSVQY